jgi:serine/threonine protein kinase
MFECLTGTLPFKSDNPLATLHQILHYDPPSLIIVNSKVSKWLSNVVGDCLIKDRNQRIQDGTLLAKILHDKKYAGSNRKFSTTLTDTLVTRRVRRNYEDQKKIIEEGNSSANATRVQAENRPLLITIFISLFIILTVLCVMIVNP